MGIYKLGEEFLKRIEGPGALQKLQNLPKINHFFLDINGILHAVAQWTFVYRTSDFHPKQKKEKEQYYERLEEVNGKDWHSLMGDYENKLFSQLNSLMQTVKPDKTICLCVDGVAPAAKISQQRVRRFTGGGGSKCPLPRAETGFSSVFITPGTEFMIIVDKLLLKWVQINKSKFTKIRHIYSSHLVRGEGEHKIFEIISSENIGKNEDNFAIEGLDSDLVSLTLLRSQHFFLVRSERKDFIDMNGFKEFIQTNMNVHGFPKELVIKDFVLILYIIGNDFLPRFLFVGDVGATMKLMMECYVRFVKTPLTSYNNTIQWTSLSSFLNCLSSVESELLMFKSQEEYAYEHPILHSEEGKDLSFNNKREEYMNYVSKEWYNYILLPQTSFGKKLINGFSLEKEINKLCKDLCAGLLWVLRYYTGTSRDNNYLFKYSYSPLISDLWRYIMISIDTPDFQDIENVMKGNREGDNFNIISQLMCVTPEKYNNIIPQPFNQQMLSGGKFNYLNPLSFPIKREGLKKIEDAFMEKAILPIVPAEELISYVNDNKSLWDKNVASLISSPRNIIM